MTNVWQNVAPQLIELMEQLESKDANRVKHTVGVGFYYFSDDLSL